METMEEALIIRYLKKPPALPIRWERESCSSVGTGNTGLTVRVAADRNVRAPAYVFWIFQYML